MEAERSSKLRLSSFIPSRLHFVEFEPNGGVDITNGA